MIFRVIAGGAICFLLGALAYGLLINRWGPKPVAYLPPTVIVKKAPAVAVTTTVARKSPAVAPTRPVATVQADNDVTVPPALLAVSGAAQSVEVVPVMVDKPPGREEVTDSADHIVTTTVTIMPEELVVEQAAPSAPASAPIYIPTPRLPEIGPAIVEILKPGYVHCSNLGVAVNCNARPMVTYDMVRLWKFTGDLTAEIRPNPFAVTAAGVAALGDIGGSDRWYVGPYFQYSFEKEQTEAGICTGFRL